MSHTRYDSRCNCCACSKYRERLSDLGLSSHHGHDTGGGDYQELVDYCIRRRGGPPHGYESGLVAAHRDANPELMVRRRQ